ncbi:MAG: MFS transporter [Nitrospirales bacterium]|nr:MFS transporter [Nitrospirales bacterium]
MLPSRSFFLLCLVAFCGFVSYDMVRRPALSLFAASLEAGPGLIGLLIALSTFTGVFLKLPIGLLSDVLDRRRLMMGGVLAFGLPPFLYPFINDLPTLGILRLVHGLATAMYTPIALAMVGEWFVERRGEAFGWYTSAAQGGGLLGPMLGGLVIYSWGYGPGFLVAGIFGGMALLFFCLIPGDQMARPRTRPPSIHIWKDMYEGLKRVWAISAIRITSLVEAAKMVSNGTLMAFASLWFNDRLECGRNRHTVWHPGAYVLSVQADYGAHVRSRAREPLIVGGLCLCSFMVMAIPHLTWYPGLLLLGECSGLVKRW